MYRLSKEVYIGSELLLNAQLVDFVPVDIFYSIYYSIIVFDSSVLIFIERK